MKYNITIKDNETGEVMRTFDTNAIIGAIGDGVGVASGICLAECTKTEMAAAVLSATKIVDTVVEGDKELKRLVMLSGIKQMKEGKVGDSL